MQGLGQVGARISFQPASLGAASHKRLRAAADRRHAKAVLVRQVRQCQGSTHSTVWRLTPILWHCCLHTHSAGEMQSLTASGCNEGGS